MFRLVLTYVVYHIEVNLVPYWYKNTNIKKIHSIHYNNNNNMNCIKPCQTGVRKRVWGLIIIFSFHISLYCASDERCWVFLHTWIVIDKTRESSLDISLESFRCFFSSRLSCVFAERLSSGYSAIKPRSVKCCRDSCPSVNFHTWYLGLNQRFPQICSSTQSVSEVCRQLLWPQGLGCFSVRRLHPK